MKRLILAVATAWLTADAAQAELYLLIQEIPGSSLDRGREQWLDVKSFGIGVFTPAPTPSDLLPSPRPTPLRIEGIASASSPHLFFGAASARMYDVVELEIVKRDILMDKPSVMAYWEFEDALVSSYETVVETVGAGVVPIIEETYDVTPVGIVRYGFNSYDFNGFLTGTTEVEWDLVKGGVRFTSTGAVSGFQFLTGDVDVGDLVPAAPGTPGGRLPADFDNDGDVDGDDLVEWRGDFGVNDFSDADNDGDSDGADFLAWQRQLGSAPVTGATAAVPEPAAASILLGMALALAGRARRGLGGEKRLVRA